MKVFVGDVRWPRSDFRLVFDGITDSVGSTARNRINLKVGDKLLRLNSPVTEHKLGGSTSNADKLVPLCFGECHNVEPLLVDSSVNEFQVHDGPIESIIEVRDDGVPVAFTPFLSTGKFRLAAQPSGQVTASVQGSKTVVLREKVVNGAVVGTAGWTGVGCTLSNVGGWLRLTGDGTTATPYAGQVITGLTIGQEYQFAYAMRSVSGAPAQLFLRPNSYTDTTNQEVPFGTYTSTSIANVSTAFVATATTMYIRAGITAGSPTTGSVEYSAFTCYATGSADSYSNNIALIIKCLATAYGLSSSRFLANELDATAFTAFATANTQPVGLYLNDRKNVIEAMNQLASSVGGRVLVTRAGLLSIVKLSLPQGSPGTSVTPKDMVLQSLSVSQMPLVQAGCMIGYCKNWTVQSNVAAGVALTSADLFKEEWLTITRTDTTTAADYLTFTEPVMQETLLLTNADAIAETNRRLAMYNVQRKVYRYAGMPWLMLESLGASQTLYNPRFGLAAGKTGQIVSLVTNWLDPHITVEILI